MTLSKTTPPFIPAKRTIGQVKWFNTKAGYGFITVSDGEYSKKDVFTHYTNILVTNSQYKYLVQGEYVEFELVKSDNEAHEIQAVEVTGIKKGPLMCETRRQTMFAESLPVPSTPSYVSRPNYSRRYVVPREGEIESRSWVDDKNNDGFVKVTRKREGGNTTPPVLLNRQRTPSFREGGGYPKESILARKVAPESRHVAPPVQTK